MRFKLSIQPLVQHSQYTRTNTHTYANAVCKRNNAEKKSNRLGSLAEVLCMCHVKCTRKPFMTCKTKSINSMSLVARVYCAVYSLPQPATENENSYAKQKNQRQNVCHIRHSIVQPNYGIAYSSVRSYTALTLLISLISNSVNHKMTIIIGSFDFIALSCELFTQPSKYSS